MRILATVTLLCVAGRLTATLSSDQTAVLTNEGLTSVKSSVRADIRATTTATSGDNGDADDRLRAYRTLADELYGAWAAVDAGSRDRRLSAARTTEYRERLDRADERAQRLALALERGQRDVATWTARANRARMVLRDKRQALENAEMIESCVSSSILMANLSLTNIDSDLRLRESNRMMAEQGLAGFLTNYTMDIIDSG